MKARRGKGTREQLLKAARIELLRGDGDVEVAKVAKRAGVSDGLTYNHFGNKGGLIRAIVADFYQAMDDQVAAIPFEGRTWAQREKQRVFAMVEFFYQDPVALIAATRLRTDPAVVAEDAQRNTRLHQLGARNIAQAQREGEIDSALNPLLLVSMILAGVMEGVRTALNAETPLALGTAQAEIWAFVARAAGVSSD